MKTRTRGGFKTVCGWALALALGFAGAMRADAAAVVEVSEHPDFTQVDTRSVGDSIYLLVYFDQNITDYEFNPSGDSNVKPTQLRLETYNGDRYADCLGIDGNYPTALVFEYVVKPGDFTLDLDCKGFAFLRNGDRIVGDGDGTFTASSYSVPLGANVASLRSTSDIQIETFAFQVPPATTVAEGSTIDWVVTRGGTDADAAGLPAFNVTITPASPVPNATTPELTYTPYPFSIPAGRASATLTLKGLKVGGPYAFTLHPDTYRVGSTPFTDGDLSVAGVTVTAGPAPTFSITPPPSALNEGEPSAVGSHTCSVVLSRPAEESVTITLSNSDPTKLQIIGSGSVTFTIGETVKTFQVQALDGPATVTIGGTANHTYTLETPAVVSTLNVAPVLNNPPDPWTLPPGAEGFPVTFNWSGSDVAADMAVPLYVIISFGDGTDSGPLYGNIGSYNHTYNTPNTYGVTITLYDKDGGTDTRTALLEVLPAVQVQLTEIVRGLPPGYKGLPGLGLGMIDDNDALTVRTPIPGAPPNAWLIKYGPTAPSTIMVATPTNVTIVTAQGTNSYDSFFHVWQGEGFVSALATVPIANPTAMLALGGENRDVSGVFSREYLPADNYADIDQDQLPDQWEELHWGGTLAFETPNTMDNPDLDFLPRGANATMAYPAQGGVYAPDGTDFGNVFEVRGLHAALNALDSDLPPPPPDDWPLDEPRYEADGREFYGTDPTNPDTDGDGMTDGWEYYFWMNATVRGIEGESYDPIAIITGNPIDSDTIALHFHPLIAGDPDTDTDGDGLSNIEEMLIGSNPIHWDSDGDYMCDGWEVFRGLNPIAADGAGNPDGDYMAALGWRPSFPRGQNPPPLLDEIHFNVYIAAGYDPRTGWGAGYLERDRVSGYEQPNTTAMLNVDEYGILRFWVDYGGAGSIPADPEVWADYSTNPFSCDTDGDGAPDGWEAYVFFDPSYAQGGPEWDIDLDGLLLAQEFCGQETSAAAGLVGVSTNSPGTPLANVNERWWNKFWPTDPNNGDTDGDSLSDGAERGLFSPVSFQYDPVPLGYSESYIRGSRAGGGLNPCCVDTDMDFIPDYWEAQYRMGHIVSINLATGVTTPLPGMDGTIFDSKSGPTQLRGQFENYDYDGDGLSNYQEYWANAIWHFNYDKWTAGLGPGAYDPAALFTGQPKHWDWAIAANYWQPAFREGFPPPFHVPFRFIQPEPRPFTLLYASTDPSLWDSDGDGMDDHYEMFHGLNPLWSETADIINRGTPVRVPDIRLQPWTAGEALADPDQDGIPNWEEALFPGRPEPANYHTDPSPLWVTDMSYPESWVNLYYWPGSNPWYWPTNVIGSPVSPYPAIIPLSGAPPSYVFSFESDEGYDSDNDNIPDKHELVATDQPGSTDPLDFDDPRRRKALYLDGASAVRTQFGSAHSLNQLRSWTVEVWVRPEVPASGQRQIIIERPVQLITTDPMPSPDLVRRTFRIGLEPDGTPFVEYNNSGNDLLTETVSAPAWILQANQWYHLSATMDGKNQRLTLYVNGTKAVEKPTALIPCTGIIDAFEPLVIRAPIVIGAGDSNPNGAVYAGMPAPALFSHFKGWVDEVRVWDGARTWDQVIDSKMRRYGIDEVLASMTNYANAAAAAIALQPADIQYSVVTNDLPAVVLYHYTFDNLPDPNYDTIVPRSFDLLNGRPTDGSYPGIPWWWQAPDRSRVYSDYLFVQWAENTAAHIPAVPVFDVFGNITNYTFGIAFDSPFWTANAPVGTNTLDNIYKFNNRTRASQSSYFTSDTSLTESFWQASDLLPLWFARADMDVPLWDNNTPGTAEYDSDGDGMPDWWEITYGLDPFDPTGRNGADFDIDGDGLSNYHEYLLGTDPTRRSTFDPDGIITDDMLDFGGLRFSDYDYVEDWWESGFDSYYASSSVYDSHLDRDEDGWDNWSEARYTGYWETISNQMALALSPVELLLQYGNILVRKGLVNADGSPVMESRVDNAGSVPTPDIRFLFRYDGYQKTGPLVVMAYSTQAMGGEPTATFQFAQSAYYPLTTPVVGVATTGRLRQGANWFFAFIDLNSNGLWDTGEPAGLADRFPYDVGWDMNEVDFSLTDRPVNGFNRLAWTAVPGKLDYSVLIRRVQLSGTNLTYTTVYTKTVRGPRNWIHEGDILDAGAVGGGNPGLDWANTILGAPIPAVSSYELRVDGVTVTPFTNSYATSALPTPVAVSPLGGAVLTMPRPEFRWTMTTTASAFELQIMPTNSVTPLYSSGTLPAPPPRNVDGLRVWSPPIHLGDILPGGALTNAAFRWRVRALQPRDPTGTASAYSSYATFNVDLSDATTDRGSIDVNLVAMYMPTGALIRVQAFTVAAFNDVPVAQKTLVGVTAFPQTVTLRGLKNQQPYYVCAYIDQDNDNARDIWESWGYYRSPALYSKWTFHPVTAIAAKAPQAPTVSISILHADTDQDKLPDSFEYAMSGGLGSMWLMASGLLSGSTFDNPVYTDLDGDGLDDMQEYLAGTSAVSADTDGDGIPDDQEVRLGLSATAVDRLLITGLGADADAASVKWAWTTEASDDKSIGVFSRLETDRPTTFSTTVKHVLERTDSLQNPVWEVVSEVSTDQKTGAHDIGVDMQTRPAGFYRIRAVLP